MHAGGLPRLVRLLPREVKFSPVAEPSPKLQGKFFLQLAAGGALEVGTSELHAELDGADAARTNLFFFRPSVYNTL